MKSEFHTERLTLRPLGMRDLETVHRYASDLENCRFMLFLPNETLEETQAFLTRVEVEWAKEAPAFYEFAAVLDGVQIGAVSVSPDGGEGELGWIFDKRHWGRGYASEAARAVIGFARTLPGITRCVAHCDARNAASERVMQKLGMHLEWDDGERIYPKTGERAGEKRYCLELK